MNTEFISNLIRLLEESTAIEEIEVHHFFFGRIRLSKRANNQHDHSSLKHSKNIASLATSSITPDSSSSSTSVAIEAIASLPEVTSAKKTAAIKSPMVGTFYRAPSPDADPYIIEGQRITKGQIVCIVEAMKLMNEIESEYSGIVHTVLVENTQPVEYGQELFIIELSS